MEGAETRTALVASGQQTLHTMTMIREEWELVIEAGADTC